MFKRISIILLILFTLLAFTIGTNAAGLFVKKDAANTYIDYVDSAGTSIMLIDDTTGVTIASLTTVNTYTSMTLTSTVDASSLTTGSFTTVGGASITKQLYLGDDIDMSVSGTGVYDVTLKDTVNDALSIVGGTTDMMVFDTDTDAILIVPPLTVTGLVTLNGGLKLGADGAGFDVTFYGDVSGADFFWNQDGDTNGSLTLGSSGGAKGVDIIAYGHVNTNYLHWDQSGDDLLLVGTSTQLHIAGTTASTNATSGSLKTAGGLGVAGACFIAGAVEIGVDDTGTDFTVYGDTTLYEAMWDASGDTNGAWYFGTDTKGVLVTLYGAVTGTGVFWDPNGDTNGTLSIGATGGAKGVDLIAYGLTNGNYMHWDRSADDLMLVGTATQFAVAGTTTSTSVTTGSIHTAGGLGVAGPFFLGGNLSIATAKIITTTAELTLNSVDPLTIQFGGVDWLQMDEAAIATFAGANDTAGHAVYIESEDGGADTGATGRAGGAVSLKTGDGSVSATATAVGGAGGALTLITGIGLTGNTTGNGGVGGAIGITAGAGGDSGAGVGVGGTGGTITLTAGAGGGAGGGVAGVPGKVSIAAGLLHMVVQTIDMADTTVVLTLVPGTPTGTLVTGNILYVDANGGSAEVLKLPHEADGSGSLLVIVNTGGETITIQDDAAGAVLTLETLNTAFLVCDGTTWRGAVCVP